MKHAVMSNFILFLIMLLPVSACAQFIEQINPLSPDKASLPTIKHNAFQKGERLEFEVSYGWIDAGEAIIEIKEDSRQIAGRDVYHIVGLGNSLGAFNWFFKVRDRYETYLDKEGVFPWIFVRDIHEGGFELKQYYTFDHYKQTVTTNKGKVFDVPLGVQDMISSFYRARTLDLSNVKSGDIFEIQAFVDNELWPLKIKYLRNEIVEIDKGKFDCMVFVPVVQKGRIFKKEEDMMVWITRDENRIPVLAKASVLVGSIKMELRSYENLANPLSKVD
ncbi:MAG: DUF3108 domain-containing protein [Salibacteraceae bacterium]